MTTTTNSKTLIVVSNPISKTYSITNTKSKVFTAVNSSSKTFEIRVANFA